MSVGESGSDQPVSDSSHIEVPDNPHDGLNAVDVAAPGIFWSIKKATTLLASAKTDTVIKSEVN
jgi:hypothetical protein